MKKAPLSPQHQARRRGALDRFSVKPNRLDDTAYVEAKRAEHAALCTRLGVFEPFESYLPAKKTSRKAVAA